MDWAFLDTDVPFGLAHQGGEDVAPGNTDAAFDHAVSLGYRYIETDVQATSDGVLVVFHDDELDALTGATGRMADRTWDEVADLRVDGHPLPRFEELVTRLPDVRFNVDPKTDAAVEPLIDAIQRLDLVDRIGIGSFSDDRVNRVKSAIGPRLATSPGPKGLLAILVKAITGLGPTPRHAMVQIPTRYSIIPLATGWLIRRYQRLGLQVHIWTIDTEPEMERLLDDGVDAIITNETALLRDVLRGRGATP